MPKPVVSKFSSAASHFKKLLDQLKDEMGFIAHSSAETFEVYREKITQNWNVKWPETLNNYKAALKELPKGLRQRDFVQTAHAEIEKFEQELNRFSEQIKNESLDDWRRTFNKQLTQANEFMGRFQASIKRMDEVVAELEENTLVQKFLRGEPVFSCRTKLQWRRKLFHAFMGLSFLYLFVYAGLAPSTKNTIAVLFIGTAIATEILRAHSKWFGNLVCRLFGPIMREHEKTKVTAATHYIISMAIVYYIFPVETAVLTMLFIAIGDPIAGIIGSRWGRHKINPHVSTEGFLACQAACSLLALFCTTVLFEHQVSLLAGLMFSILAGLAGAIAEASFKKLDDNLVMPLLSAPTLWVLMHLFGVL